MVKRILILVLAVLVILVFGFSELAEAGRHGGGGRVDGGLIGGGSRYSGRYISGGWRSGGPYYGSRPGSPRGNIGGSYRGYGRGFGGPIIRGPAIRGSLPRGAIRGGFWGGVIVGGIFNPFWWPFYALPVPFGYYALYGYPVYYQPPYVVVVPQQAQPQAQEPAPSNCYGPRVNELGEILRDKDGNLIPDFGKPVPCPPSQ